MPMDNKVLQQDDCPYCEGRGYHQPPLTGTETCTVCHGSGEKNKVS